jgi:hypothetical protein
MPPPDTAAADITKTLTVLAQRRTAYLRYRDYYEGRHNLNFATEKFRNAFGALFQKFANNLCPSVVDALADRLDLEGFTVEEGPATLADTAWKVWLDNRMDRRAGETHTEAGTTGDAYVIVWPDPDGRVALYPNLAERCLVVYDEEWPGRILWGGKAWLAADDHARCTLYYPDRLEKYRTPQVCQGVLPDRAAAFEPWQPAGEPWPLPNKWGRVPLFHLANNGRTNSVGCSELRDVLPLQDAVNKTIADRLVGAEFQAFAQRWVTGIEVPIDETTGKPLELFTPGADRIWATANEAAKFGQFEAANLAQLRDETNDYRLAIAQVSRTPLHYILPMTGDFPSGEALKTAEAAFLAKVDDRQVSYGNFWEDIMRFALQVAGAGEARLSAQWRDAAPRSELEYRQGLEIEQKLGVPQRELFKKLGYGEQEITAFLADVMQERAQAQAAAQAMVATQAAAVGSNGAAVRNGRQ